MNAQAVFIARSIELARSLPLKEAVVYVRGLCQLCQDEGVIDEIRRISSLLSESDRQLELIQTGQLKLRLS
jgi:hypothetical protein